MALTVTTPGMAAGGAIRSPLSTGPLSVGGTPAYQLNTGMGPMPTPTYPTPAPPPSFPPLSGGPPGPGTFGQGAPTPTPFNAFVAPNPLDFQHSPDYAYNVAEQQKAIQRSAASHGTLLTGGLLKSLDANQSGLAAGDFQNAFNRSLSAYTANRQTAAQNFGEQMDQFGGNLNAFNANTNATLGGGRLALDSTFGNYDRNYAAGKDQQAYQQEINDRNAFTANASAAQAGQSGAAAYAAAVESARRQNEAESARLALPIAKPIGAMNYTPSNRGYGG